MHARLPISRRRRRFFSAFLFSLSRRKDETFRTYHWHLRRWRVSRGGSFHLSKAKTREAKALYRGRKKQNSFQLFVDFLSSVPREKKKMKNEKREKKKNLLSLVLPFNLFFLLLLLQPIPPTYLDLLYPSASCDLTWHGLLASRAWSPTPGGASGATRVNLPAPIRRRDASTRIARP